MCKEDGPCNPLQCSNQPVGAGVLQSSQPTMAAAQVYPHQHHAPPANCSPSSSRSRLHLKVTPRRACSAVANHTCLHRSSATATVLAAPQQLLDDTTTAAAAPEAAGTAADSGVHKWQQRTHLLLGADRAKRLHAARVLVVGLGGVGSFAAEFLARAGVGSLTIVDGDVVDASNQNRQLVALQSTVGQPKVKIMEQRLREAAPSIILTAKQEFLVPETVSDLVAAGCMGQDGHVAAFDWVVDAIDSLEPKKMLIAEARVRGIPVIAAMGAGGRLDAAKARVVPLSSTFNDPFAANVRKGLRKKGVDLTQVPCVWSDEPVTQHSLMTTSKVSKFKRSYHGTISYLPAQFGLLAASHIINSLVDGPAAHRYKALPTHNWGMPQAAGKPKAKRQGTQQQKAARSSGGHSTGCEAASDSNEAQMPMITKPGPDLLHTGYQLSMTRFDQGNEFGAQTATGGSNDTSSNHHVMAELEPVVYRFGEVVDGSSNLKVVESMHSHATAATASSLQTAVLSGYAESGWGI